MFRGGFQTPDFVHQCVDASCPECWKEGCGCDGCFGTCADCLESVQPVLDQVSSCIWILGSPLAFPCIFFFSPDPHTNESSGYEISMLEAPTTRPITCCLSTMCVPCAQYYVRKKVLNGDMVSELLGFVAVILTTCRPSTNYGKATTMVRNVVQERALELPLQSNPAAMVNKIVRIFS